MSTFNEWMAKVDAALMKKVGVTSLDLTDFNYRDAYDAGEDPSDVADEVLEDNGWDGE